MPLNQYNYPQPTGLQQLGDTLLRGSGDYANIQLQRQQEERRRAQQVADLQDQRKYSEGRQDVARSLSLEDEERRRAQQVDDQTYQILLKEGWLKPNDATNPVAIAAAADRRQQHIDKQMADEQAMRGNAAGRASAIEAARDELRQKATELNAILQEPEPEPNPAEVVKMAVALAKQGLKPDEQPKENEIAEQYPAALAAIRERDGAAWYRRKEDARLQAQLLRAQASDLSAESNTLANRFGVVGAPVPAPAAPQAPLSSDAFGLTFNDGAAQAPAPAPGNPTKSFFQVMRDELAKRNPPPAPPGAIQDPSLAPAYSPLGAIQRIPALLQGVSGAPTPFQRVGGGLRGILQGDFNFSPLAQDPLIAGGNAIGNYLGQLPPLRPLPPRTPKQVFANPVSAQGMLQRAGF